MAADRAVRETRNDHTAVPLTWERSVSPAYTYLGDRPPTVDELTAEITTLAREHADVCEVVTIGKSRRGEDLTMLIVPGNGPTIQVVGGPHPNEPVGLATVTALARYVVTSPDVQRCSWYLLPCIDPDGARLNEAWWSAVGGPTLESYHRGFFRPAEADQPDWGLPRAGFDGVLPEGQAVADAIDRAAPDCLVSLHNSDTGGVFCLSAATNATLVPLLMGASARHGLPVEVDPSDAIEWASPGPGVHVLPPAEQMSPTPGSGRRPFGASSVHHAHARGATLAFATETPMWTSSPHDFPAEDAARHLEDTAAILTRAAALLTPREDDAFLPAITDRLGIHSLMAAVYRRSPEAGSGQDLAHLGPLRTAGMVLRALDTELAHAADPALKAARDEVDAHFVRWLAAAETALRPEPIPLARAAGFQLDLVLSAAEAVTG
ncbi:M14 family zinc carboxypeptidase [Streptomyces sp. bgisy060]|uniref:M14 family zinc carboxypeptidase n=1 Tax=Streptomyces sp. bgisy060 TaxID=3413775 RepID=UPI003EBB3767